MLCIKCLKTTGSKLYGWADSCKWTQQNKICPSLLSYPLDILYKSENWWRQKDFKSQFSSLRGKGSLSQIKEICAEFAFRPLLEFQTTPKCSHCALKQWLSSWGSYIWLQGQGRDDKGQGRNLKQGETIINTARSLKDRKAQGKAEQEILAFVKKNLKIYISLYFVLRLAAPPKASWASTSECLSVELHYGAHRLYPQLLHEFQTQIYVLDGYRQLSLHYRQSAFFMSFFLFSPYFHISSLLSPSPSSQCHLIEQILY